MIARLDAIGHRLKLPRWVMHRICDAYDRQLLGGDNLELLFLRLPSATRARGRDPRP